MSGLPRRAVVLLCAALIVLFVINVLVSPNFALQRSETSFGVLANGYKAAYDLLRELGIPATRSYLRPKLLGAKSPLWMVFPYFLDSGYERGDHDAGELLEWIQRGGTAVVFGESKSDWARLHIDSAVDAGGDEASIAGQPSPRPREIPIAKFSHFRTAARDASVMLRADGSPFAIQVRVGAGRLIAVADGRFLVNSNLASGDSSLLAVDLARAFGAPAFDEYSHGLAAPASASAAILESRAVFPLALGLLAAMVWIAEQHTWPPRRRIDESAQAAPSIASFVESLGELYSRARDPAAAFRAYRGGFLRRMHHRIAPRGEFSEQSVIERLLNDRSMPEEAREWLRGGRSPRDEAELVNAARAIESCARRRA